MTRKCAFETTIIRIPDEAACSTFEHEASFTFPHKYWPEISRNPVPTHRHSFTLWSTPLRARWLRLLSSRTLGNQITRLHVGSTSIAPPFPALSNILRNLATLTFGNTSQVVPANSRSVTLGTEPFYLLALKPPMSLNSPKRPSLTC